MDYVDTFTQDQVRTDIPSFHAGDTLNVYLRIIEGDKERIQLFTGVVIQRKGSGVSKTFTIRKISNGVGVERIIPINSPKIDRIEKVKEGKVRQAKILYLRERKGKSARIKEVKRYNKAAK